MRLELSWSSAQASYETKIIIGGSSWTSARASFETINNRGSSWAELQLKPHFNIIIIIIEAWAELKFSSSLIW
jgi:hypothetical protein